jgi:hypothetical protein
MVVNVSGCEIRLRGVAQAVLTERLSATATPVSIIRGPNLDRELRNDTFNNSTHLRSGYRGAWREFAGVISWSGCSHHIDRQIDILHQLIRESTESLETRQSL